MASWEGIELQVLRPREVGEILDHYSLSEEQLEQKIPERILNEISFYITEWELLAIRLGLTTQVRENIRKRIDIDETVKGLLALEKWSQRQGKGATYYRLMTTFIQADRRDLAEKVCESYKYAKEREGYVHNSAENATDQLKDEIREDYKLKFNFPLKTSTRKTYVNKIHTRTLLGHKTALGACTHAVACIGLSLILISIIVIVTLSLTKYAIPAFPSGQGFLRNDDTVLLLEYNPKGTENVTFTTESEHSSIKIYNNTCDNVINQTVFVNQTWILNISVDHELYPLQTYYLLIGSNIQYSVNISFAEDVELSSQNSTCMVDINIFDEHLRYTSFLSDKTSTSPSEKHCLSNIEPNYTITALSTRYYFAVLHIPSRYATYIDSIAYTITGLQNQYITTGQPISCLLNPEVGTTCTIYPASTRKLCVLAKTLSVTLVTVSYSFGADSKIHTLLLDITIGLSVSVGGVISTVIILLLVYRYRSHA